MDNWRNGRPDFGLKYRDMPNPLKQNDPLAHKLEQIRRDAEERDAERRAARAHGTYVNLAKAPISLEAIQLIPEAQARAAKAAAIESKAQEVALAAYDPQSPAAAAIIKDLTDQRYAVRSFYASESGLAQAWDFYKYVSDKKHRITGEVEIEKKEFEDLLTRLTTLKAVQAEIGAVQDEKRTTTILLETLLAGAMNNRASDIHLEAGEKAIRVRFRVDGLLHDVFTEMTPKLYQSLVSRIKLLSGLKINVRGEAQDGRFTIELPTKQVEVRVSIIPSQFGETIVMRILDPDATKVDLATMGLRPDDMVLVEKELARPNGLILNTGPTGSGKTTTLYAFLRHILNPEIKIITIEDPIEYRIEGVEQTQVDPEAGYTFVSGLRAILRQDPDSILVGEIRDKETADIATQASLTGHMVLSTLHTNDAIGAVPRLLDLGVKAQTIGPALTLVIAQRLLRKLCPDCRKPVALTDEDKAKYRKFLDGLPQHVDRAPYEAMTVFEAAGCAKCNNFGYKGRVGVFEFLKGGAEMEEIVIKDSSEHALRELAKKQEMVFMQQDGILKVLAGLTTLKEVEETTGAVEWA